MKFLFEDEAFSFEALRAAGYAGSCGADLGEVLVTCRQIPDGDEEAWSTQWAATAARIESQGRASLDAGHTVSAREALLRASNYYRTADFFRREDPAHDAESRRLAGASQTTFADAATLLDHPARQIRIPYQDTTLPGYLFMPDDSGRRRPTLVFHGGFDSTVEEAYHVVGAAAMRRGYNVIAFDGPGQGSVLRDQGLTFRPDWEAVVSPVIDYALTLPEVDPDRIALAGMSQGGLMAARAASQDHRIAACILYDGVLEADPLYQGLAARAAATPGGIGALMAASTQVRWMMRNARWTFGIDTLEEFGEVLADYTVRDVAADIVCPTLVLEAEHDAFSPGQPRQVFDLLQCPKTFISFPEDQGGGEHCQEGAMLRFQQETFDWLDERLAPAPELSGISGENNG